VRTPGVYRVEPGESLRDLVARVGGFTPQAYLFGSEFTRESTRLEQQARLEEMAQQIQRDAQRNATLLAAKAGDNTGLAAKLQLQQSMVNTMKPLKATGRMVLNLRPSASTVDALPKLVLEDGDHFYVPSRSSSLSVFGEVVTPSTFVFEPRKRIRDYLRDAGGMTRLADGSRTYVLRANGSTVSVRSSADLWNGRTDDLKLMPGDAIVVSQRLPQIGIMSGVRDWAQLLSQFGLTAAAINVLR
jgi:protein involved in polysaccharide export with SLBB domain